MADTKITLLDEGTILSLLDWLVFVDVSFTSGPGFHGPDGTDVKVRLSTLIEALRMNGAQLINPRVAAYTPVLGDQGKIITMTNAINIPLTLPAATTVPFPVGTWFDVIQLGAGKTPFVPEGGIPAYRTVKAGSRVRAQLLAVDSWHISGELETV